MAGCGDDQGLQQQEDGSGEQMACQVSMKELLWRDTPVVLTY